MLLDAFKISGNAKNLNWGRVNEVKPNKYIEDIDKEEKANQTEYDAGMMEYKRTMLALWSRKPRGCDRQ